MAWTQIFSQRSTPRVRYHRNFLLRVAGRIVLSVVLGCAATECLYIADKLKPYSVLGDRVTDVLTFPGFIVSHCFQFVSIHTAGVSDASRGGSSSPVILFSIRLSATLFWMCCIFLQSSANCDGCKPHRAGEPLSLKPQSPPMPHEADSKVQASGKTQLTIADIMHTSIRSGSDNSEPGNRAGDATVP